MSDVPNYLLIIHGAIICSTWWVAWGLGYLCGWLAHGRREKIQQEVDVFDDSAYTDFEGRGGPGDRQRRRG